jgi:mannose-1-phosphate guanylyltransferase
MFVFHAGSFMDCLKKHKPDSHEGLMKIQKAWGTKDQKKVLDEVYPTLPRISVDYAVMEPASKEHRVCTVLTDVQWLDVGSWPSFGETLTPDAEGNRVADGGGGIRALIVDGKNNLVVGDTGGSGSAHTVALLGVKDLIVVHTKDATLVMPRDKAEQLKKLHGLVADELK